jgi:hypothetical protein
MSCLACMAGELRTFLLPCVHGTWRAHFFEPMRRHYGSLTVVAVVKDDFTPSGILWRGEYASKQNASAVWRDRHLPSDIFEKRAAATRLLESVGAGRDLDVVWFSPQPCETTNGTEAAAACVVHSETERTRSDGRSELGGVLGTDLDAYLAQQALWMACLARMEYHERTRGHRFDAVVRVRPDLLWHAPFPSGLRLKTTAYLHSRPFLHKRPWSPLKTATGDWVFAVPRELASAGLGFVRSFCDACAVAGTYRFRKETSTTEDLLTTRVAGEARRLRMRVQPTLFPSILLRWNTSQHEQHERLNRLGPKSALTHQLYTCLVAGRPDVCLQTNGSFSVWQCFVNATPSTVPTEWRGLLPRVSSRLVVSDGMGGDEVNVFGRRLSHDPPSSRDRVSRDSMR